MFTLNLLPQCIILYSQFLMYSYILITGAV